MITTGEKIKSSMGLLTTFLVGNNYVRIIRRFTET